MSKNIIANNQTLFSRLKNLANSISKFEPIAIQFITIDKPGGNMVFRYLISLNNTVKDQYIEAEKIFTGVTKDQPTPLRTLVNLECKHIYEIKTLSKNPAKFFSINTNSDCSNFIEKKDAVDLMSNLNSFKSKLTEDHKSLLFDSTIDTLDILWEYWTRCLSNSIPLAQNTMWISEKIEERDKSYYSSFFLVFKKNLWFKKDKDFIYKKFKTFLTSYILQLHIDDLKNHATRAAISQVMARNMSHNIGSHVLSKLKSIEHISGIANDKFEEGQYKKSNQLPDTKIRENKFEVYQLASFNDYLKTRMDFLSDIATSDPVMENSLWVIDDLFKVFENNRLLLNRISGLADIDFKYNIELYYNDVQVRTLTESKYNPDFQISVPNDILGLQAFYVIIENIIRNIAKHGNPVDSEKKKIKITIRFTDFEENPAYYKVQIFDNLWRDKQDIISVVKSRNEAFKSTILNEENNYKLRENNLGTIEMDVCSAYLRCKPINSIDGDDYELPLYQDGIVDESKINNKNPLLIYAYLEKATNEIERYSLGYTLFINKPKEVLVIDDDNTFPLKLNCSRLEKCGIKIIRSEELDKNNIYNFQILYKHNSHNDNNILNELYAYLPKRIVSNSENIEFDDVNNFIKSVWIEYIKTKFDKIINYPVYVKYSASAIAIDENFNIAEHYGQEVTVFIDLDHASNWNKMNEEKNKNVYYEMKCSHHKIDKLIDKIVLGKNYPLPTRLKCEYVENVFTKIVVLDERIQENLVIKPKLYKYGENKVDIYQYFRKQKVFIPTPNEANLNIPNFFENNTNGKCERDNIKDFILKYKNSDFFIIHLGILEKMLDKNCDKNEKNIETVIKELFPSKSEKNKLVVTSGRGTPNNLPPDICFLSFASVQNALETVFDKFVLTKLIYNSRKNINNEKNINIY